MLKRHAEAVARARGETLSQYVLEVLATRVAEEIVTTQELHLTVPQQIELLRILAAPAVMTPALETATKRAEELFGV